MKQILHAILPVALTAVMLITSSCTSSTSTQVTKLLQIVATDVPCVAEALYDAGTLFDRNASGLERTMATFSILKECIPAAIKTYTIQVASNPSASFPSDIFPYVDIEYELSGKYPVDNTYQGQPPLQVVTNAVSNCSTMPAAATVYLSAPFRIFLQSKSDLAPLSYDGTKLKDLKGFGGTSDADFIANQLYYDTFDKFHGPVIVLGRIFPVTRRVTVPARTTASLAVTYTVSYRKGGALVSRRGKAGEIYAWLYVNGLTITDASTYQTHAVTASECP